MTTFIWWVLPVGQGWTAAYRVIARERRPVISELRLIHDPDEAGPYVAFGDPGPETRIDRFAGSGITSAVLERVRPGQHVYERLASWLGDFQRLHTALKDGPRPSEDPAGRAALERSRPLLEALFGPGGFDSRAKPDVARRGPKGWSEKEYAELVADYLARHRSGSRSPAKDSAAAHRMSSVAFRAALRRARLKGVFQPGAPGKAGGQLTEKGESLLGGTRASAKRGKRAKRSK